MGPELTELLGNSTLLDEPEAQGAEGVPLGGFGQLESVKVPVVCSSQHSLHLWNGRRAYVGQVAQLPAGVFVFKTGV